MSESFGGGEVLCIGLFGLSTGLSVLRDGMNYVNMGQDV